MRINRDVVRIVVPPLLAAGLVIGLIHPADTAPLPTPSADVAVQPVHR